MENKNDVNRGANIEQKNKQTEKNNKKRKLENGTSQTDKVSNNSSSVEQEGEQGVNKKKLKNKILDSMTKEQILNSIRLLSKKFILTLTCKRIKIKDDKGHCVTISFKESEKKRNEMIRAWEMCPHGMFNTRSEFFRSLTRLGLEAFLATCEDLVIDKDAWEDLNIIHALRQNLYWHFELKDLETQCEELEEKSKDDSEKIEAIRRIREKQLYIWQPDPEWKKPTVLKVNLSGLDGYSRSFVDDEGAELG